MNHKEAFCLMAYQCESCQFTERVWNSRDGVTPFMISCRRCGDTAQHVNWRNDLYAPKYDPAVGDRYFRNGLEAEARGIVRRRLESAIGTEWEKPKEVWKEIIDSIVLDSVHGEFQEGWPMIVVRGTDQDTLPMKGR